MTDISSSPENSPRFKWLWIPGVLFRPRRTFAEISAAGGGRWLAPMLILSLTALLLVFAGGWVSAQAALMGETPLPPDFEYLTPEQQTQYLQAAQALQSPAFLYVLPAMGALIGIWVGWLVVGGMLHLATTLFGGRGDTGAAMNVVAWAGLPFALRDLVRIAYILITRQTIQANGVAGFIDTTAGGASLFFAALLALVDIYLIWHTLLLWVGARSATNLNPGKALLAVILVMLITLGLQALLGFGTGMLSQLTVTRPYFF